MSWRFTKEGTMAPTHQCDAITQKINTIRHGRSQVLLF